MLQPTGGSGHWETPHLFSEVHLPDIAWGADAWTPDSKDLLIPSGSIASIWPASSFLQ